MHGEIHICVFLAQALYFKTVILQSVKEIKHLWTESKDALMLESYNPLKTHWQRAAEEFRSTSLTQDL